MIPVIFHNLKGYDSDLIMQYVTRQYAPNSIDVLPTTSEFPNRQSSLHRQFAISHRLDPSTRWYKVWLRMA